MVMLLMLPAAVPQGAAPGGPSLAATETVPESPHAEAWNLLFPWLLHGEGGISSPTSAVSFLDALFETSESHADLPGWDAYFTSFDLDPTPGEWAVLREFMMANPHVAAEVESLVGEVAAAEMLRAQAFGSLDDHERGELSRLATLVAAGRYDLLTEADHRVLGAVDLGPMVDAAFRLSVAAERAQSTLETAQELDEAWLRAIPGGLRDPATLQDPAALLRSAAGGATPAVTTRTLDEALGALANVADVGDVPTRVPADLAAPLANLATALALHEAEGSDESGRVVLATLAAELPRLVRAGYNVSVGPPGAVDSLAERSRPLHEMKVTGLLQPLKVLEDLVGPSSAPPKATLPEGLRAMHESLGIEHTADHAASAHRLERLMGSERANATGSLLAAQAAYQRDLSPDAPVVRRAEALSAQAGAIVGSGSPLLLDDLRILRESVLAQHDLHSTIARDAGAILLAALTLQSSGPADALQGDSDGVLYQDPDGVLLVLGTGGSHLTTARVPVAPILLLDLGGDDRYSIPMAGVSNPNLTIAYPPGVRTMRTSVAVDLGGDDLYDAVEPFTLGAALGAPGVPTLGVLLDAAGDDHYFGERNVLGWGVDGFGIVVDVEGDDHYHASGSGLAGASSTTPESLAAGIFLDSHGNDTYRAGTGFAHLYGGATVSPFTSTAFLDLNGADFYEGDCPADWRSACFATPRPGRGDGEKGVVVFVDANGDNTYPRGKKDPYASNPPASPFMDYSSSPDPSGGDDRQRFVYVRDGPLVESLGDGDGDLLPDVADPDPSKRFVPTQDSDGDGYPDEVERAAGTDPHDGSSHPERLPEPGAPFDPSEFLPRYNGDLIVNKTGLIAVGLPGPSRYTEDYLLTIDLGLADSDTYLNRVAFNALAVDLGGNDVYRPARPGPAIGAAVTDVGNEASVAALVDLGGHDLYVVHDHGQAYAWGTNATAILLDAGGDDVYRASNGRAQAHAVGGATAILLDLDGNDRYEAMFQGVLDHDAELAESMVGGKSGLAVFLDRSGSDEYRRANVPTSRSEYDAYQGTTLVPFRDVGEYKRLGFAAFLDLEGADTHRVIDPRTGALADISSQKNNHLRIRPLGSEPGGAVGVYLDVGGPLVDSDGDGADSSDAVETAAGTSSNDRNDKPVAGKGFVLRLPRLGIALGSLERTVYSTGTEFALLVDLGGDDLYLNRVGSSTPAWGTSLAVDLGGVDVYRFAGSSNLTDYNLPAKGGIRPGTSQSLKANFSSEASVCPPGELLESCPNTPGGVNVSASARTYEDVVLGGAHGAGILGVGVLRTGRGTSDFNLSASFDRTCSGCENLTAILSAGQGAGVLGVGVLSVPPDGNASFVTEVVGAGPPLGEEFPPPRSTARTLAQGAGLLGLGLLSAENVTAPDVYELRVVHGERFQSAASSGQGYGLFGVGALIDQGGDNEFRAERLAQGVGDAGLVSVPIAETVWARATRGASSGATLGEPLADVGDHKRAVGSVGLLVLPGIGDDRLRATRESQAFAKWGGVGIVLDDEGDDTRTLAPPRGVAALGQGAAMSGGLAILLDNRGDDRYESLAEAGPDYVQGFSNQGVAFLVDLSGRDHYEASTRSQGHVHTSVTDLFPYWFESELNPALNPAFFRPYLNGVRLVSFATLLDRTGDDTYVLKEQAPHGQGSITSATKPSTVTVTDGNATALFLDTGGADRYLASPVNQVAIYTFPPFPGPPSDTNPSRPPDGNNWAWRTEVAPPGEVVARGIDSAHVTQAYAALDAKTPNNPLTNQNAVMAIDAVGEDSDADGLNGVSSLIARILYTGVSVADREHRPGMDRVDFLVDGQPLGRGVREVYAGASDAFVLQWDTNAVDAKGFPLFADGTKAVEIRGYPRIGTPDVHPPDGIASGSISQRRAAVDGEPFVRVEDFDLDNPPIPRSPSIDTNVSTASGTLTLPLRVDRDLEAGDVRCVPCEPLGHLVPGPEDDWDARLTVEPLGGMFLRSVGCEEDACPRGLSAWGVDGRVFVSWQEPEGADSLVGYRILRTGSEGGAFDLVGFMDVRAPLRFVDEPIETPSRYRIDPVRHGASGLESLTGPDIEVTSSGPSDLGPVTGLRALGREDAVHLVWNPLPGAQAYEIRRHPVGDPDGEVLVGTSSNASYSDESDMDVRYAYRVHPVDDGGVMGRVPSVPAVAARAPGHWVSMTLEGEGVDEVLLDNAAFGGLVTHDIPLDVAGLGISDGVYHLNTTIRDAREGEAVSWRLVRFDSVAPQTVLDVPQYANADYREPIGLRVPFTVTDDGSGPDVTAVAARIVDRTPWGVTTFEWPEGAIGEVNGSVVVPGVTSGDTVEIAIATKDRAGNVDGLSEPLPWNAGLNVVEDALADLVFTGRATRHLADFSPPLGRAEATPLAVRPDTPVIIQVRAEDGESGLAGVVAHVADLLVPLNRLADGVTYEGRWIAAGAGRYAVLVNLTDAAGNVAQVDWGVVTVDSDPPTVSSARIVFGNGRVIGHAGDTADVRVVAADALTDVGKLKVVADVGGFSSSGVVNLTWDAATGAYSSRELRVDRLTGTSSTDVTIVVTDPAGNSVTTSTPAAVNGTPIAASPPVVEAVGPDWAVVRWTTEEEARGRVDYGVNPALGDSTPVGPRGTEHRIRVEGLKPDTDHFAKAVSVSDAGIETPSDLFTFHTGPALNVTWTNPRNIPFARSQATLEVLVTRYDGSPTNAVVDAFLQGPRGSPRLIASTEARGPTPLVLDLADARDGDYRLILKARHNEDWGESAPIPISVDRSAPILRLKSGVVLSPRDVLTLSVEERGTGIDMSNVSWTFGTTRCAPYLEGGSISCVVPDIEMDGLVPLVVRIPDRAGNVATVETRLPIDASSPRLSGPALRSAEGFPNVRPGTRAVLSLDVEDIALRHVTADLSMLGGSSNASLRAGKGALYEIAFDVPLDVPEGPVTVTIRAGDGAGRVAEVKVRGVVDATPPKVLQSTVLAAGSTKASIAIRANEPVTVSLRATGMDGEIQVSSGTLRTHHHFEVDGLPPGAPFEAVLRIVDGAGHESGLVVRGETHPDRSPPSAASDLVVTDLGDGLIRLGWAPALDDVAVLHYRVVRSVDGNATVELPFVNGTSVEDSVPLDLPVSYSVAAVDHGGNEGPAIRADGRSRAIPRLFNGTVDPPTGGPGVYEFKVDVRDASGRTPTVTLSLDGVNFPMTSEMSDCRDGCTYRALVPVAAQRLDAGPHRFSFHASSGAVRVDLPEGGNLSGPVVLDGAPVPTVGLLSASRVPAVGIFAAIALAVTVAVLVPLGRRRWRS